MLLDSSINVPCCEHEKTEAWKIGSELTFADVVGAAGIEPATLGLEIRCSIRLSYAPASFNLAQNKPLSSAQKFPPALDEVTI